MEKEDIKTYGVKNFLFKIVNEEFGYSYIPEYHKDIINMENYYIYPDKNIFLLAFLKNTNILIGTLGIRSYDKDYDIFKGVYNPESTASIWRAFIDKKWRRNGIGSKLISIAEAFCKNKGYKNMYLHTQKTVPGSLDFWLSKGYTITKDMKNGLGTVHMEKNII